MFQGGKQEEAKNEEAFQFDPADIECVEDCVHNIEDCLKAIKENLENLKGESL